jgi:hypothetical protein
VADSRGGPALRWIGWVVVVVALGAMTYARLTDETERRGREPTVAPLARGPSHSPASPIRDEAPGAHHAEAAPESL